MLKIRAELATEERVWRVANVHGTSCDSRNWLKEWIKATGETPDKCKIHGCSFPAEVGGHMYVEGKPDKMNYILPICEKHNHQKAINCDANHCQVRNTHTPAPLSSLNGICARNRSAT